MNLLGVFRLRKAPHAGNSILAVSMLCGLAACSTSGYPDLEDYVRSVKARPGGRVEPVPEIKSYRAYAYSTAGIRSPFLPEVVVDASKADEKPEQIRNKEALESFPLDALKLVGHVEREGESWAVITAPDGLVYKVQVGNYAGQNQGRIHRITEDRLLLTERVPAPNGGWVEREASLALVE